jgi:hypothetical protein
LRIPASPALALAAACEKVLPWFGLESPLFRRRVHFFLFDRAFTVAKMRQTGFELRHVTREGLCETAQWYVDNSWIQLGRRPSSVAAAVLKDVTTASLATEALLYLSSRL